MKKLLTAALAAAMAVTTMGGPAMASVKVTAGHDQLWAFAPKFAQLNDEVLFGEVWSRTDKLPLKTRSMLTVTTLVAKGITDSSLAFHLATARKNGVTRTEMAEMLTHVAFYAGWPNAWAAFRQAKEVYKDDIAPTSGASELDGASRSHGGIFGQGEPNTAYAQYFIGNSYLKRLTDRTQTIGIANVTFEPRCRNNWHVHHATRGGGQVLVCVDGEGWYQEWGKAPQSLRPGDVVTIPANVKHWHGAKADGWFSHLSVEVPGEGASNEWLEPVSDAEYDKL